MSNFTFPPSAGIINTGSGTSISSPSMLIAAGYTIFAYVSALSGFAPTTVVTSVGDTLDKIVTSGGGYATLWIASNAIGGVCSCTATGPSQNWAIQFGYLSNMPSSYVVIDSAAVSIPNGTASANMPSLDDPDPDYSSIVIGFVMSDLFNINSGYFKDGSKRLPTTPTGNGRYGAFFKQKQFNTLSLTVTVGSEPFDSPRYSCAVLLRGKQTKTEKASFALGRGACWMLGQTASNSVSDINTSNATIAPATGNSVGIGAGADGYAIKINQDVYLNRFAVRIPANVKNSDAAFYFVPTTGIENIASVVANGNEGYIGPAIPIPQGSTGWLMSDESDVAFVQAGTFLALAEKSFSGTIGGGGATSYDAITVQVIAADGVTTISKFLASGNESSTLVQPYIAICGPIRHFTGPSTLYEYIVGRPCVVKFIDVYITTIGSRALPGRIYMQVDGADSALYVDVDGTGWKNSSTRSVALNAGARINFRCAGMGDSNEWAMKSLQVELHSTDRSWFGGHGQQVRSPIFGTTFQMPLSGDNQISTIAREHKVTSPLNLVFFGAQINISTVPNPSYIDLYVNNAAAPGMRTTIPANAVQGPYTISGNALISSDNVNFDLAKFLFTIGAGSGAQGVGYSVVFWAGVGISTYIAVVDPVPTPITAPTPPTDECCAPKDGPGWNDGGEVPTDDEVIVDDTPGCEESGGEADDYTTAAPSESFEGQRELRMFVEVNALDYSTDPATANTQRWAVGPVGNPIPDPSTYEGGFKKGIVRSISGISGSLSNEQGDPVGTQMTFNIDDGGRDLRSILDDADTRELHGVEASLKIVSETRRRSRGTPTTLVRGIVKEYGLSRRMTGFFTLEDLFTSEIGPFGPSRRVSDRVLTKGLDPFIPKEYVGRSQRIIVNSLSDAGAIVASTGVAADRGVVPLWEVGTRTIDGTEFTELHVCGHAIGGTSLYGRDSTNTKRVKVDESEYGVNVLVPGRSPDAWPFADKFFDRVDADTGLTHRVTRVFVKGPLAESHLLRQITLAANVCGATEDAEGLGRVISGYFQAWQWLLDNWMLPSPGYYTGAYTGAPTWSDGVRMTNSQSFKDAQAWSALRIGGEGYIANFMLQELMLNRDILKRLHMTSFTDTYWSPEGQFTLDVPDSEFDVSTAPLLIEPSQVRAGIVPRFDSSTMENPVVFSYWYDYDAQSWRVEEQRLEVDAEAKRRTGGRERPSQPIECWMSNHRKTVYDAMQRRQLWNRYPSRPVQIDMPIDGLDYRQGQIVRANSYDGIGQGYSGTPFRLRSWSLDSTRNRVIWDARDVSNILLAPGLMISDVAADTDLMTADIDPVPLDDQMR